MKLIKDYNNYHSNDDYNIVYLEDVPNKIPAAFRCNLAMETKLLLLKLHKLDFKWNSDHSLVGDYTPSGFRYSSTTIYVFREHYSHHNVVLYNLGIERVDKYNLKLKTLELY